MKFKPRHIKLKNNKTVEIREAAIDDAQGLIDAAKKYLRDSDYLLSYEEEFTNSLEEEVSWIESMDNDNSLLLVAVYEGEILSTFSLHSRQLKKINHTAEIAIAILKEWQGLGLGFALFNSAITWCKENTSLEILYLDVFAENTNAYHLYQKIGFTEDGRRKNYYKTKSDKYIDNIMMSLNINQINIK